jgi:MFS family permease
MNLASDFLAKRLPVFYGYVMLPLAMLMQIGTSPGQTFAISAFTPALLESLQLSESRLALAYMLGTLCAAVPLSVVGPVSDRFGLRWTSLVVVLALSATCYLISTVTGFAGLFVAFLLLRFLGQGSLTLLSNNTTAMWFRNRIGRVSAIISIGTAAAFAWVPQWLSESIDAHGWRWTYQALAVIVLVVLAPAILLLYRDRPEDLGQLLDGDRLPPEDSTSDSEFVEEFSLTLHQALRTFSFYIVGLASAAWAMIGTGIVFYLFTLCQDRGMADDTPSDLFKTFGLCMLAMQFAGSIASDYVPLNRLLGSGAMMLAGGLVVLFFAQQTWMMHFFAVLFGGGQGLLIAVSGVLWVRYYGRKHLGSIRGWVWCATVAGSGCGPLIMGQIKDHYQSYDLAILIFLALISPLAIASWFVRPPQLPNADVSHQ